jgi:uncharacterized membrane protein YphA (DoxX/SURF4 family)
MNFTSPHGTKDGSDGLQASPTAIARFLGFLGVILALLSSRTLLLGIFSRTVVLLLAVFIPASVFTVRISMCHDYDSIYQLLFPYKLS